MNKRGQKGETLAAEFLQRRGFQIIAKNWRGSKELRSPEIDIIAQKDSMIVFVEVKSCNTGQFGSPEFWITKAKQKRLSKGAGVYLALNLSDKITYRFDAIIVDCRTEPPIINHIENAFAAVEQSND
jgi:putative endonuclease